MSQQFSRSLDYIVEAYRLVHDNPDEAVHLAEKALICSPRDTLVLEHLGFLYKHTNRTNDARETLEMALENEPKSLNLQIMLSQVMLEQKEYESASRICERVLSEEPENLGSMIILAKCYDKLDRKDDAERVCLNAIKRGMKTKRKTGWLSNLFLSSSYKTRSGLDGALQRLEYENVKCAYNNLIGLYLERESSSFFKTFFNYLIFKSVGKAKIFIDSIKP